jgi:hypothetical protein
MRDQRRKSVVVPFRARPRINVAAPASEASQATPFVDVDHERLLNADWDALLELTVQACTWRDPESLAAVERVLTRLIHETGREWST